MYSIEKNIILTVLCISIILLVGCGANETKNNNESNVISDTSQSSYKEEIAEVEENPSKVNEEVIETKTNTESFADQAKDSSTLENPIKMNEVGKIELYSTFAFKYEPIYLRATKKISHDEALKYVTSFNDKYEEGSIYRLKDESDTKEWHGVIFEFDLKDYETYESGASIFSPTFLVYRDINDKIFSASLETKAINLYEELRQGDIVQMAVVYQWPKGDNSDEILEIRKGEKYKDGEQYFLIK